MKKIFLVIIFTFSVLLFACLKLDNQLFNNQKISEYKLDNYTGEQDFVLDASFNIPSHLINLLTIQSGEYKIKAFYIGDINKISTDTVIVYCHGNKWHMDFYWQRAKLLAHVNGKNHYGIMMMDYRGFGLSEGKPSEEGLYEDVDACLNWLKNKGLTNNRLIIYGFSLGSAPATKLSAEPRSMKPSKIILEAPFASAAVMVQDGTQLNMPADYFTGLKINNADMIKKINQPLLWIHGTNDNFLNYKTHGQAIYNNHSGIFKDYILVEGADHGEIPLKMGFSNYLNTIGQFIRKIM